MGGGILVCSVSDDSVSWGRDGGNVIEGGRGGINRVVPCVFRGGGSGPCWI